MATSERTSSLDWRLGAPCTRVDPEVFFPDPSESAEPARQVCRGCGVRAQCLEFALANDVRFGVWGGLSEAERRELGRVRQETTDPGERLPGLTPRGDGRWAICVKYRRPDGMWAQLSTTVHGDRKRAVSRLHEIRRRADLLAAGLPDPAATVAAQGAEEVA